METVEAEIRPAVRALDASDLRVRPFDPEQDTQALMQAGASDDHRPLYPTHVIERAGEIVGYFGLNSLPLYRIWFHSEKLKASDSMRLGFLIENHYRMAGAGMLATVVNTGSPFFEVMKRLGYAESEGDRLFLKGL